MKSATHEELLNLTAEQIPYFDPELVMTPASKASDEALYVCTKVYKCIRYSS